MKKISNSELSAEIIDWPVYMQHALDLACNVLSASPNPRVGCVIVKGNDIVGEGWHIAPGQAHAEAMALQAAGDQAESAIVFVSLEPCCHSGRTGPCTAALIEAKVSQVVIAAVDPNPSVAGEGIETLSAAGIEVIQLLDFELAARAINPGYLKWRESGLPYVRCKMAMSLDGRTALANGESKWITAAAARADVQKLRVSSDAVVTGVETILADDPSLNVRVGELALDEEEISRNKLLLAKQPLRVILDSNLRTPDTAKLLNAAGPIKIYTARPATKDKGLAGNVEILVADQSEERVNLRSVLESLASEFSCTEVLIEAGATLSGAFLQAGLIDELIIYIAPKLMGSDARSLFNFSGLQSLSDCAELEIEDIARVGGDIRLTVKPVFRGALGSTGSDI